MTKLDFSTPDNACQSMRILAEMLRTDKARHLTAECAYDKYAESPVLEIRIKLERDMEV